MSKNGERMDWFWEKVEKTDTCWEWRGSHATNGYGRFQTSGGSKAAHRISYEALTGPVPRGLELDHLCRNRSCVNPEHLEPVTHQENVLRGQTLTGINAAKTHCDKGHPLDGANLYLTSRGSRECRICRRDRHREYMREYRKRAATCA
jgi:hypothetical protein